MRNKHLAADERWRLAKAECISLHQEVLYRQYCYRGQPLAVVLYLSTVVLTGTSLLHITIYLMIFCSGFFPPPPLPRIT